MGNADSSCSPSLGAWSRVCRRMATKRISSTKPLCAPGRRSLRAVAAALAPVPADALMESAIVSGRWETRVGRCRKRDVRWIGAVVNALDELSGRPHGRRNAVEGERCDSGIVFVAVALATSSRTALCSRGLRALFRCEMCVQCGCERGLSQKRELKMFGACAGRIG